MRLKVLQLALEAIALLCPVVARIRRHDRSLAKQITDAANSVVLNIGEGAHSDGGTRKARYQSAAASASEVRVGLLATIAWSHVTQAQANAALAHYDRIIAMLYKLVRS